MDELEKDNNVKMKLIIQVTNYLWGGKKDSVYKKSYAHLLEHILLRNHKVKRKDDQNPEVAFYELARGIKESNMQIQEKKTCKSCDEVTRAIKTVPFVKLPNSKKKTQSVKLALAIYMGKAQPKKDETCETCSSSDLTSFLMSEAARCRQHRSGLSLPGNGNWRKNYYI